MKTVSLVLVFAFAACAQEPVFEVATVKPSRSARPGSSISNSVGGMRTENTTLQKLICYALGVQDFQVTGGPAWIRGDRFDINASNGGAEAPGNGPRDEKGNAERFARIRKRLLHLLEERFQLQLHQEQREVPVFALTVDKGGLKIKQVEEPLGNVSVNGGAAGETLSGKGLTMPRLCQILSSLVERPVIDETGVAGAFDVEMKFSRDRATADAAAAKDVGTDTPAIFTAVKEQLGLRLNARKGMADTWVVVRAEKPGEN